MTMTMISLFTKRSMHRERRQQQQHRQQLQRVRWILNSTVEIVDFIVVDCTLKNIVNETTVSYRKFWIQSQLVILCWFAVIHARVTNQHETGQWISYLLTVVRVYKDRLNRIQQTEQWIWVSQADAQCSCPRLKLNRQYLFMGFYDQMQTSLTLDRTSVVIEWRPRMEVRMNRFRRFELNQRCWKWDKQINRKFQSTIRLFPFSTTDQIEIGEIKFKNNLGNVCKVFFRLFVFVSEKFSFFLSVNSFSMNVYPF